MAPTGLFDHKRKKNKLITPWNDMLSSINGELQSWCYERLPEYLWIALILERYGRTIGLEKCYRIIKKLREIATFSMPRLSDILALPNNDQEAFFEYAVSIIDARILYPLSAIYTYTEYPAFSRFFSNLATPINERIAQLNKVLKDNFDHQSYPATDVRFVVLYFALLGNRHHIRKEQADLILKYPRCDHADEEMRIIRPTVRSMEMLQLENINLPFLTMFWERISDMSDCEIFSIKHKEETADMHLYSDYLFEIFEYLGESYKAISPLDNRMLVLLGLSTYAYKRLQEVVDHNLPNSIIARGTIRVLIEIYIMIKYLLSLESHNPTIWEDYQYYGIGQYKLIVAKQRESGEELPCSHVQYKYLEILVNEYRYEEYIDMDLAYFDKEPIRKKAEHVGEKNLYDLYYDYDSAFEHGLWGAIRESALIKCNLAAHQYHCVPDYTREQNMPSVWHDLVMVMNKIIAVLHNEYGVPDNLLTEVNRYEEFITTETK